MMSFIMGVNFRELTCDLCSEFTKKIKIKVGKWKDQFILKQGTKCFNNYMHLQPGGVHLICPGVESTWKIQLSKEPTGHPVNLKGCPAGLALCWMLDEEHN